MTKQLEFFPLDITYKILEGQPVIHIFAKNKQKEQICLIDKSFKPYFWVEIKSSTNIKDVKKDFETFKNEEFEISSIEIKQKKILGKETELLQIFTQLPEQVPKAAKFLSGLEVIKTIYESDIKFALRYLIDKQITPLILTSAELISKWDEPNFKVPLYEIKNIKQDSDEILTDIKILALDIETYNSKGKVLDLNQPIIMLSLYSKNFSKVLTWKKFKTKHDYIEFVNSEKELLKRFNELIEEQKPDFIVGYYSDGFDFPYIKERADKLNLKLNIGLDNSNIIISKQSEARIIGMPHIDIFKFIKRVMGRSLSSNFYTLNDIAEELLSEKKHDIDINNLAKSWDTNKNLGEYCKYNLRDSELAHNLTIKVLPNMLELIRVVGLPPYNISRVSHSQLVESYILKQTPRFNEIILNRPKFDQIKDRDKYQGAFVFQPSPGLYKDIVVLDFKSFYPSIIASYNIGPSTINCNCCKIITLNKDKVNKKETKSKSKSKTKELINITGTIKNITVAHKNVIDTGKGLNYFCQKKEGFVPSIIKDIIIQRTEIKRLSNKNKSDLLLKARSQALKDLSNAFYGYLGFTSARWYNYECAESVTAFSRQKIQEVIEKATKKGFKVIYGDTDSIFITLNNKSLNDVQDFVSGINKKLPELIELELEENYPAGIFVSTKHGVAGAKKRYALLTKNNKLKVKGFESVRRNISPIAKTTQEKILQILLKENDINKAFNFLKKILSNLKDKKVPLTELIITTSLQKPIEDYKVINPQVTIAKRMVAKGLEVYPGTILRFIIVDSSKLEAIKNKTKSKENKSKTKISDRVRLPSEVKEGDYDSEYYINNQILPSITSIFEALGYSLEQILTEKNQSTLDSFFK